MSDQELLERIGDLAAKHEIRQAIYGRCYPGRYHLIARLDVLMQKAHDKGMTEAAETMVLESRRLAVEQLEGQA